jgi:hypothetical protein
VNLTVCVEEEPAFTEPNATTGAVACALREAARKKENKAKARDRKRGPEGIEEYSLDVWPSKAAETDPVCRRLA